MSRKKTKKGGVWRAVRTVVLAGAVMVLLFVMFVAVRVLSLDSWNEFDPERITGAAQTLILYDANGAEYARLHAAEDRIPVELKDIPYTVRMAFISAEDARFYDHIGVDFIRIAGALWADIKAGGYVQGASTISQQLIKLSHLTSEKTMARKLEEAVLACQMEQRYSKDEILNMYLNYVYFGGGYYGIEAAARGYFGVSASELTVPQAAMLAGILKSPSGYAPHLDMEASVGRRNLILGLMQEYGYISEQEEAEYVRDVPDILHDPEAVQSRGYYVDTAVSDAMEILAVDSGELLTGGYRIYTFVDPALQARCEELFKNGELFPEEDVQAAIALMRTGGGGVAALIGGRGEDGSMAFNRAVDIRRQPGSLIKPIITYAPALETGAYTAASILRDEPTDFFGYSPANFNNKYYGYVTLREAVTRSLNIPAVAVLSDIGVDGGMEFARGLGIEFTDTDRSLALALGGFTYGVSPLQMAAAYSAFASGGLYSSPSLIAKITDAQGNVIYEYQPEHRRVMSEQNAFILTDMLRSVIEEGTGHRLGELGLPLAGKTGTVGSTGSNRDAWMAAYNPEYAAAVWMGYDSNSDGKYLPNGATGGNFPARVLYELFSSVYPDNNAPEFTVPEGVSLIKLDRYSLEKLNTAVLANAMTPQSSVYTEYFAQGTAPGVETQYWAVPRGVRELSVRIGPAGLPEISFTAVSVNARHMLYRQDPYGNVVMLKSWTGAGRFTHTDDAAEYMKQYVYWVVPVHAELVLNGKKVTGPSSVRLTASMGAPVVNESDIDITSND